MAILDEIKPRERKKIYDMVRDAGVDVSDWHASKGMASSAASNPKYCYNWSFVQAGQFVVLNLWHSDLKETAGIITVEWNARKIAQRGKGVTTRRAMEMDEAIQKAYRERLPVRVVLCEGTKRNRNAPKSKAPKVQFRALDPEPWHIERYNMETGQTTLIRGLGRGSDGFADQFDMTAPLGGRAERDGIQAFPYVRRPDVRRYVLLRAKGRCEYCGAMGFTMANGQLYLETHHVVPLHEQGLDSVENVVALCPNHHREAHHGKDRTEIRKKLQEKLALLTAKN